MQLAWGSATHRGTVRTTNQDATLAGPTVFAVADGMGGHAAGEIASSLTISALAAAADRPGLTPDDVVSAVRAANDRVAGHAATDDALTGMGTTVAGVAVVADGEQPAVEVFHVGDSRVYLLRDGRLRCLTADHAQPRGDGRRPALTRAVGRHDVLEVDHAQLVVEPADRLLVCSDGLTTEQTDEDLEGLLAVEAPAAEVAQQLLDAALEAGARDNVSVIVVDVVDTAPAQAVAPARPGVPATAPRPTPAEDDTVPGPVVPA